MIVQQICSKCGKKHGKYKTTTSTWHIARCDVCGIKKGVTQGRDFGVYEIDARKVKKKVKYNLINDLIAAWGEVPLDHEGVEEILREALNTTIDDAIKHVMHSDMAELKQSTKDFIIDDVLDDYV